MHFILERYPCKITLRPRRHSAVAKVGPFFQKCMLLVAFALSSFSFRMGRKCHAPDFILRRRPSPAREGVPMHFCGPRRQLQSYLSGTLLQCPEIQMGASALIPPSFRHQ